MNVSQMYIFIYMNSSANSKNNDQNEHKVSSQICDRCTSYTKIDEIHLYYADILVSIDQWYL